MIVYRVESEHGEGPFTGHSREDFRTVGHEKDDAVWYDGPNPLTEALNCDVWPFTQHGRVCGVDSPHGLSTWFREPAALAALGYLLTVWDVDRERDDVDAFIYQVVFNRTTATLLNRVPVPTSWDGVDALLGL